ncbi:hypothetical protein OEZ86_001624 [Tetradesmus obliquus]|nr:hypothetical protein OEZ86_001624 [Tetradesmus obliquus]
MDATRIVMHQIVAPTEVDALGICFGGQVLSWIDVCAGLSAKTLARGPCVTISVDAVHFFRPCRRGDVVIIAAMVNRTFSSSMEVGVKVEAENMRTGARRHCCSAYLSFVSLKGKARPQQQQQDKALPPSQQQQQQPKQGLPRVLPTSSEHRRIHIQADARRQQRLAARQAAAANPQRAAAAAACRLQPITHREGCPTLPPSLSLTRYSPAASFTTSSQNPTPPNPTTDPAAAIAAAVAAMEAAAGQQQQQQEEEAQRQRQQRGRLVVSDSGVRRRVPPSATTAYMTQSVLPQHANTLGITFGGQVMSWMEQCAYISASRLRGTHLLTAGMDSVTFAASTKVGDILYITAQVSAIFGASLEVMISVFGETPADGNVFHCADAFATLVVTDLQGAPTHIPFELEPSSAAERLRYEGAQQRRAERLAMRGAMAAVRTARASLDGCSPGSEPAEQQQLLQQQRSLEAVVEGQQLMQ